MSRHDPTLIAELMAEGGLRPRMKPFQLGGRDDEWGRRPVRTPQTRTEARNPKYAVEVDPSTESDWETVVVKVIVPAKGYVFLQRQQGLPDVFATVRQLNRSQIFHLDRGDKIEVKYARSTKGLRATELRRGREYFAEEPK